MINFFSILRFMILTVINFSFQFGQQAYDTTGVAFGSQATREYGRGTALDWLHMQVGGFERTS